MKNAEMVSAAEALVGLHSPPAAAQEEPLLVFGMTTSEFWEWWLPYPDPDVPDTHFHHFDFSPREHLVPAVDIYPTIEKNKEYAASILVSQFIWTRPDGEECDVNARVSVNENTCIGAFQLDAAEVEPDTLLHVTAVDEEAIEDPPRDRSTAL